MLLNNYQLYIYIDIDQWLIHNIEVNKYKHYSKGFYNDQNNILDNLSIQVHCIYNIEYDNLVNINELIYSDICFPHFHSSSMDNNRIHN
jgi:hypothetical protein